MSTKSKNGAVAQTPETFIIAEAGVNHNGSVAMAKKLIDAAVEAGADAVKFQTFKTENVVSKTAEKADYQKKNGPPTETQYDMVKKLELGEGQFKDLAAYAAEKDIIFLSSPFDHGSVDVLDELGVPLFKIPSGEITNMPLLEHIAKKGKPIILSTGMATLEEIDDALAVLKQNGGGETVLLHCVSDYPTKIEDVNLRVMETLASRFGLPVGLSDHTLGITVPIAAVACGARVIEKHFTLDKSLPGPDHKASLDPCELKNMVGAIRDVEKALGDGVKTNTPDEEKTKNVVRRGLVAAARIKKGEVLTKDNIAIRRPERGLLPKYYDEVRGSKRALRDIAEGEPIEWDLLN